MLRRTWNVVWFAIRTAYEDAFVLSGMGLLWFLMAVGLPMGVYLLTVELLPPVVSMVLTALSFVLAPPATAAVFHVAWYLARERRIEFAYFWQGFREYLGSSWKVSGVMLVVLALLLADAYFFLQAQRSFFAILGFLMLWLLLFWLTIQVYLYPLLIALEEKRVGLMFRNAAQLVLAFPLFSFLTLLVALLSTALSVVLIVLLPTIWMPFVALLFSRAFVSSWDEAVRIQQRHQATESPADEQADEPDD